MNGRYFTDFLEGHGTFPVLFEPFLSKTHSETLIWRRGEHLWATPDAAIDTLLSLTERTRADVIVLDPERIPFTDALPELILQTKTETDVGFCLLCRTEEELKLAQSCADCVGLYGSLTCDSLPVIRMDGSIEDAIARSDCGYFAQCGCEELLENYGEKIRILGGLGVDYVSHTSPVEIYDKIEDLYHKYPGQWACGSGGEIGESNYLELISLLGGFGRIR